MDYKIICVHQEQFIEDALIKIELKVRTKLNEGWKCQGGLIWENGTLIQAMTLSQEKSLSQD